MPREDLCAGECKRCRGSGTRYDCDDADDACPVTSWEPWGNCTYESFCAPNGSRTRTGTDYVCTDGKCNPEAVTETETAPCDRGTENKTCQDPVIVEGLCRSSSICAQSGTQTVTTTTYTCKSGDCVSATSSERRTCPLDTNGDECGSTPCDTPGPSRRKLCCFNGSCNQICSDCI